MRNLLLLLIPTALLGCVEPKDDPRLAYAPHSAGAWTLTPGGITRDAGPFASVERGYLTDDEIDAALDAARADFVARFPEFAHVSPLVHLTDDYVFFAQNEGWAAGMHLDGNIYLALYTRSKSVEHPGDFYIVRPPGDSFGTWYDYHRYTAKPLVPAYQHEALHAAIGDPLHSSPAWSRL